MRELNLTLADAPMPAYLRLARALRDAIRQGQACPGELLPSTRRLSREMGLHRHTVMAALEELIAEGWIEAEAGRGYRVSTLVPLDTTPSSVRPARTEWNLARDAADVRDAPGERYAFSSGQPDLRLFPVDEYYRCIRDVLRRSQPRRVLGYQAPGGAERLIEELRVYLRRMRGLTDGDIVVTHGSQEAIFLLGQLLIAPGDAVAVEALGYPPAWDALRLAGAELVNLPLDDQGVVPERLGELARKRRVKMLYVTPLHQYPTTVTLPMTRRLALYTICERHGITILEDDYDHEFHFRSQPLPPMATHDPAGLVLYVSTFSKVLYPAARLGFAVVPSPLVEALRRIKRVVSRQNDTLVQEALARWMAQDGFERHLRRMRRVYERRMGCMADALEEQARAKGLSLTMRRPDGGMSLWVSLGVDTRALAVEAARHGVSFTQLPHAPPYAKFFRLGYASSNEEDIREGIRRLAISASVVRRQDR